MGKVELCHPDPVLQLPIIIGTYPISDAPSHPASTTSNGVIQQQPTASKVSPSTPPLPNESSAPLLPRNNSSVMPNQSAPIQFPNDGELKIYSRFTIIEYFPFALSFCRAANL